MENIKIPKPWYKKWWGILLIMVTWPISLPSLLIFLVWKKTDWNNIFKIGATIFIVIVFGGIISSFDKTSPNQSQPSTQNQQPKRELKQAFDIPALLGKNIDQLKTTLGVPSKDTEPTKQQANAGIDQWDKTWVKDGEELMVTYDVKTRKIVSFFIDTTDPSGLTIDKEYLEAVGNIKTGQETYDVEFVEAINNPGKYTGIKVTPVDLQAKAALIQQRKSFDSKHGTDAFSAQQALDMVKSATENGLGMNVYIETKVPDEIMKDYLGGGKETTFREKTTSAIMTVVINNTAWALSPDSTKQDLVASLVSRLKRLYPNAVTIVRVTNGIRTVAEGSWSVWNGEAKVELK
jgi:hypothetical protein